MRVINHNWSARKQHQWYSITQSSKLRRFRHCQ